MENEHDDNFDFVTPDSNQDEPILTEEEEQEFIDASRIGRASEEFTIYGNKVVLHTLTVGETLSAAAVAKSYKDTEASFLALKTAMVAVALESINGEDFYRSISTKENEARGRFDRLTKNYYSDFVTECYKCFEKLELEQRKIAEKVKKAQD